MATAAQSAVALEVNPGDKFTGADVFKVLTDRSYNLKDNQCIQKTVLQSPQHQAFIAIGAYLETLYFNGNCVDSQSALPCLTIQATYLYPQQQVVKTIDLGSCDLQK